MCACLVWYGQYELPSAEAENSVTGIQNEELEGFKQCVLLVQFGMVNMSCLVLRTDPSEYY